METKLTTTLSIFASYVRFGNIEFKTISQEDKLRLSAKINEHEVREVVLQCE